MDKERSAARVSWRSRVVAVGGAIAILAHVAMASLGGWMAVIAVVMACVCAPCVRDMYRTPNEGTARMLMSAGLAMMVTHVGILLAGAGLASHDHGAMLSVAPSGVSSHDAASLLVIVADLLSAFLAALWLRRERASRLGS